LSKIYKSFLQINGNPVISVYFMRFARFKELNLKNNVHINHTVTTKKILFVSVKL